MHMNTAYFSKFPQEAEPYPLPDYREVLLIPDKEVNRWNVGNHIVKKIRNLNKKCNSYKNINETEGNNPSRNINETENNEKKLQKQHHITSHVLSTAIPYIKTKQNTFVNVLIPLE